MKRLLFFLIILFLGCENDEIGQNEINQSDSDLNALMAEYGGKLYNGSVQIFKTKFNEYVVCLDENRDSKTFEQAFVVQTENSDYPNIRTDLVKGSILYLNETIVIKFTESDEHVIMSLDENSSISEEIKSSVSRIEVVLGFGISSVRGKWKRFINEFELTDAFSVLSDGALPIDLGRVQTSCVSGGCGATQCTQAAGGVSCSVTCKTDYFACCQSPLVCRCVKATETECPTLGG